MNITNKTHSEAFFGLLHMEIPSYSWFTKYKNSPFLRNGDEGGTIFRLQIIHILRLMNTDICFLLIFFTVVSCDRFVFLLVIFNALRSKINDRKN